jgi:PAS domain S-box-containing protein
VIPFEGEDCIISLVRDVTERKAAEEALRQSEDRFRTFVENAADAFFMIAPKGRIQDVNRQACESLGYTREELLQLSVPDINAELSPEELMTLKQRLSFETPTVIETWHRRKDGSVFPAEVSICRFGSEDNPREIALARDITERKQAQAAMARLAEIGELSAMIVHEVRSPLTTVLMGLESFQGMELPERAQMRLGLALEEADRLKTLLNEILQYAREQTLEVIDIDLMALVRKLQGDLADLPYAQERVLTVESTLPEAWIKGDTDKLKQVFINLVRNACEAIEAGDTITWRIARAEQPHRVCVSVHNGGPPIPPEVLDKLGQPFFTTKSGGNGLGIAIVKRIVEAHQGDFFIESTAEQGTTVRVILPLAQG